MKKSKKSHEELANKVKPKTTKRASENDNESYQNQIEKEKGNYRQSAEQVTQEDIDYYYNHTNQSELSEKIAIRPFKLSQVLKSILIKLNPKAMKTHEFHIPRPLFLSILFRTNATLIIDNDDNVEKGHAVELIEVDQYNLKPTGRKLTKIIYDIKKPTGTKLTETYYQLTIVDLEQYNRLSKI